MLFYRAWLPLSRPTLDYLTGVVRRHRTCIGSKGRALKPAMQALIAAIDMAALNVQVAEGAVFHSDRGSNYISLGFAGKLKAMGIRQSVGRTVGTMRWPSHSSVR